MPLLSRRQRRGRSLRRARWRTPFTSRPATRTTESSSETRAPSSITCRTTSLRLSSARRRSGSARRKNSDVRCRPVFIRDAPSSRRSCASRQRYKPRQAFDLHLHALRSSDRGSAKMQHSLRGCRTNVGCSCNGAFHSCLTYTPRYPIPFFTHYTHYTPDLLVRNNSIPCYPEVLLDGASGRLKCMLFSVSEL